MAQIRNIVFDNDGVNINSEHIAVADAVNFIYELLRDHGGENAKKVTSEDIALRIKGNSSDVVLQEIISEFGINEEVLRKAYNVPAEEDVVANLSNQHTLRVIDAKKDGQICVFEGFEETMEKLVAKYGADHIGLCTASRADRMDATEYARNPITGNIANWGKYFRRGLLRFSGHNLKNKYKSFFEANPHFDPAETVCIEDSPGSVKKAIEAGAHSVIGCAYSDFQILDDDGNFDEAKQKDQIRQLKEAGAAVVITDYRDLPIAIEWVSNGMDMNNFPSGKLHGSITHNNWPPKELPKSTGPKSYDIH